MKPASQELLRARKRPNSCAGCSGKDDADHDKLVATKHPAAGDSRCRKAAALNRYFATALNLAEMDVSAIESPDLGELSLEPLAHQHCHTLTSSSGRKERDIAALLIKQVRQRSVLDEIRARFLRIDLAE